MAAPRIVTIALSTYAASSECSADRSVVTICAHRARCAYGHRWVRVVAEWRCVGSE